MGDKFCYSSLGGEMKKYRVWIVVGVVLLALIVLVMSASSQTSLVPRASNKWSRGYVIGHTPVKRRVAQRAAPDGSVFLIWPNMAGRLELARVGTDGEVLLKRVLSVEAREARDPWLHIGANGRLFLLWREGEYPNSTLLYVLLEADGTSVSRPWTLSDPGTPVLGAPCMVAGADDRYHVIWADDAGIQWAVLDAGGTLLAGPTALASAGRFPAAQLDGQGRVHLIWQRQPRAGVESIYYGVLDPESGVLSGPEEVAQIVLRTGQGLGEPVIGLTQQMGYVLWVVRDFKYVASSGEYISFPLGSPHERRVEPLRLRQGRYPDGIYALEGGGTPLLVALDASVPDQEVADVVRSQIAVVALGQGEEEQVVSASPQASIKPVLVADDHANLHLAWLESADFGEYRVVYASTAPGVMKSYNALTLWDVLNTVFGGLFRLSTLVVAMVAVLIMWGVLPFLVLVVYHLITGEETLNTVRSRGALVIALALEVTLTYIQPPRIGVQADWPALRWVAPTVSTIVAALIVWRSVRGRKYPHLFVAYFLFVGVSSLLQMLMYYLL
jgi:hypothetical protein